MIVKKNILFGDIQNCIDGNGWNFGNRILYEMCENSPKHESAPVVVGKIWLIGRSYAAAIERRKNANVTNAGDDFYFNDVAPKMLAAGQELDERIASLKNYECINENNLQEVVEAHCFLTDVFSDISGMSKRSLASKYLHFHVPNMFYIYDSRAVKQAKIYTNANKSLKSMLDGCGDKDYIDLATRLFGFQKYVEDKYNIKVSPRVIDAFLLKY